MPITNDTLLTITHPCVCKRRHRYHHRTNRRPIHTHSFIRAVDPSPSVGSLFARPTRPTRVNHPVHSLETRTASHAKQTHNHRVSIVSFVVTIVDAHTHTQKKKKRTSPNPKRTRTHLPQRRVLRLRIDARARLDDRASSRHRRTNPRGRRRRSRSVIRDDPWVRRRHHRRRRHQHHRRSDSRNSDSDSDSMCDARRERCVVSLPLFEKSFGFSSFVRLPVFFWTIDSF